MIETFSLYLTAHEAYLRRTTGYFGRGRIEDVGQWEWNFLEPLSLNLDVVAQPMGSKSRSLHVYLGSALCNFVVGELPDNVRNRESSAVASAQMAHRLGLTHSEWEFTSQTARGGRKTFTCALRRDAAERIRFLAAAHRLRLVSMRPFAANLWNECTRTHGFASELDVALIAVEEDTFTTLVAKDRSLQSINRFFHRRESDVVTREVNRLQLSYGMDQKIGVALSAKLRPSLDHQGANVIQVYRSRTHRRRLDFGDLMFQDEEGGAL